MSIWNSSCRTRPFWTLTFDEYLELLVPDETLLYVNLETEQQREEELVTLVETAARVAKHLEIQVFDDKLDALARHRALGRPGESSARNGACARKPSQASSYIQDSCFKLLPCNSYLGLLWRYLSSDLRWTHVEPKNLYPNLYSFAFLMNGTI